MRTKLKKLTSVCLAVIMILSVLTLAPFTVSAAEEISESVSETSGDFEYEYGYIYGEITITGYTGSATNLTIPSEIDEFTVTEISRSAFEGNTSIKSVTIPAGVTSIETFTFRGCTSLTSVTIPRSVTSIGYGAFIDCTSLTSVTIPDSVTYIDCSAFENCRNLTSVTISGSVTSIESSAFSGCTSLTSVAIPDSVTSIGSDAFANTALSIITIPASVQYIYEYAFGYMYNEDSWEHEKVDSFTISGYTNSEADVYARENGFDFVSLGEASPFGYDVLLDGTVGILEYRGSAENLTIPSEIDGHTVKGIGSKAFYGNTSLASVTIPDSVTYIDEYAFADCVNLKSVTIPASVQDIDEYAFGYIYNEDSWEFEKVDGFTISGFTNSEADLYADNNGFGFVILGEASPFRYYVREDGTAQINGYRGSEANLTIPSEIDGYTVTEIWWDAFYGNTSLESVTIPDSVTFIWNSAFKNCENLTSVIIPDSVTSIGDEAFSGCTSLTSVTIPDSVTSIEYSAFSDCTSLTSVTIPDSVTYIESGAFANTALSDITIPASVQDIYGNAFGYVFNEDICEYEKIDDFTIYGYTNSEADVYARNNGFKFVSLGTVSPFIYSAHKDGTVQINGYRGSAENLTIPSEIDGHTVKGIGSKAFYGNTSLTSVTIPDSVTYIGEYAFADCKNLKSVTIPNTVQYIWDYAFAGCKNLKSVTIPDSVIYIGGYAFADCTNLKSVTIPASVQDIYEKAFGYIYNEDSWEYEKVDGFTIYGYDGTRAEEYAVFYYITFISLGDVPAPTLGDVNGDGSISIDDVTDIQKYLANMLDFTSEQAKLADVDKKGGITIDDVTLIQKSLAGLAVIK